MTKGGGGTQSGIILSCRRNLIAEGVNALFIPAIDGLVNDEKTGPVKPWQGSRR